jgi:peptide/nickel transport system substrate-binding protein
LDLVETIDVPAYGIFQNIQQPLVYYNNSQLTVVPVLATNYSISSDGMEMTFNTRPGITFSNGDPFNAYCVWYTYYRAALMNGPGTYEYSVGLDLSGVTADQLNQFNSTSNMPPASLLPVITNSSNAIWVPNPNEIHFRLVAPYPDLLGIMTNAVVVDPSAISLHGGVVVNQPNSWANLNPIGTGPFVLTSWIQGSSITLQANPTYWGGPGHGVFPQPKLSKVVIRFVTSGTTREEDIRTGAAQVVAIDSTRISVINGTQGVVLPHFGVSNTYAMIPLDVQQYPLNITQVREAVVHAIDFDEINRIVYSGQLFPTAGSVPYGIVGYNSSLKPYSYDPALASNLLAQAGFPNGTGLPSLSFYYATDYPESYQLAQVVQANLAAVGIHVALKGLANSQLASLDYSTSPSSPDHPALQWLTYTWFPLPSVYAEPLFSGDPNVGFNNFGGYNNTQVTNLLYQARTELDTTRRAQLYMEASNIIYNDYAFYFEGNVKNLFVEQFFAFRDNVHGYYYNSAFAQLDFSTIYLS